METVPCEICGHSDTELVFKDHDTRYQTTPRDVFCVVRCRSCGLIYLNPRPDSKEIAEFYPQQFYEPRKERRAAESSQGLRATVNAFLDRRAASLQAAILREKVERLSGTRGGPGKLLEIGCATGVVLKEMKDRGWDVLGVDISADMAAYAREQYDVPVLVGDLLEHDLEPGAFDVVSLWSALPHLPEPGRALTRIAGLLRDDGRLLASCVNADSLEWKLMPWNKRLFDIPRHLYQFTPHTLEALARKSGLRPRHVWHRTRTAYSVSYAVTKRGFDGLGEFLPGPGGRAAAVAGCLVGDVVDAVASWGCALVRKGHTFVMELEKLQGEEA